MSAVGFCLVCRDHYSADEFVGHNCRRPPVECPWCPALFPSSAQFLDHVCPGMVDAYEFLGVDMRDVRARLTATASLPPSCVGASGPSGTEQTPNRGHLYVVPDAPADIEGGAA